jgi:hypothetical protein
MFHFYKRLVALRNEYFNELDNKDLEEIGSELNHDNQLSSEYLIRYMKNWSDSMKRRNEIDLNRASLSDIRKALEERGKQKQFMSEEDRKKVHNILLEYRYGWFMDDHADAMQLMTETNFGYECITDDELLEECKEYVDNHDDIDEDSYPEDIFMANLVAKYELEKALEL